MFNMQQQVKPQAEVSVCLLLPSSGTTTISSISITIFNRYCTCLLQTCHRLRTATTIIAMSSPSLADLQMKVPEQLQLLGLNVSENSPTGLDLQVGIKGLESSAASGPEGFLKDFG